jgi:hypothetical protein
MKNHNYNLITELSEQLRGLWRFEQYIKDAQESGCQECARIWQELRDGKMNLVERLRKEVENHVRAGGFN